MSSPARPRPQYREFRAEVRRRAGLIERLAVLLGSPLAEAPPTPLSLAPPSPPPLRVPLRGAARRR